MSDMLRQSRTLFGIGCMFVGFGVGVLSTGVSPLAAITVEFVGLGFIIRTAPRLMSRVQCAPTHPLSGEASAT